MRVERRPRSAACGAWPHPAGVSEGMTRSRFHFSKPSARVQTIQNENASERHSLLSGVPREDFPPTGNRSSCTDKEKWGHRKRQLVPAVRTCLVRLPAYIRYMVQHPFPYQYLRIIVQAPLGSNLKRTLPRGIAPPPGTTNSRVELSR